MTEQLLDVRGSARLVRRSWRLVGVLVLLGAAGVGAYEIAEPPTYHASALVLVPAVPGSSASGATSTAASHGPTTASQIALSADVLMPAARSAGRPLSLRALEQQVSAVEVAPSILRITAAGSTPSQSEALANAVASHFVRFMTASGASASSSAIAGLESEASQLETQAADVRRELAAVQQRITGEGRSSVAGKEDASLASQLAAEESALGLQLSSVTSQISEAQLGQVSAAQGTEVIQRASTAALPSGFSLVLPIVLGGIGGVLVGSVLAVARNRRDPRLRTRDALAEALGAPVVLALDVKARRTIGEWSELFERHQPSVAGQWAVRKALRELGVDEAAGSLEVLSFGDDRAAVALAAELALATATSGFPTTFSVIATGTDGTALRSVCSRPDDDAGWPRPNLRLVDGDPAQDGGDGGLSVTAVVLDEDGPGREGHQHSGVTVLAVSSGFASSDQVARTAIATADAGRPICGILLANPAPDDQTVGRPRRGRVGAPLVGLRGGIPSTAGRQR